MSIIPESIAGSASCPGHNFQDVVIRRRNAVDLLRNQLFDRKGKPRYNDPSDNRVVFGSTLVDVAANMTLLHETAELVTLIMEHTHWHVRLLSKSPLLAKLVDMMPEKYWGRLILGFSTGTLDDAVARTIEVGTGLVSKRIEALHTLQDRGIRTFAMICPSLPQTDYVAFSKSMCEALRIDKCEHLWAEVLNVRGSALPNTISSLRHAGLLEQADLLKQAFATAAAWDAYARKTFEAHALHVPPAKLRFLQYPDRNHLGWWADQRGRGAYLLGKHAKEAGLTSVVSSAVGYPMNAPEIAVEASAVSSVGPPVASKKQRRKPRLTKAEAQLEAFKENCLPELEHALKSVAKEKRLTLADFVRVLERGCVQLITDNGQVLAGITGERKIQLSIDELPLADELVAAIEAEGFPCPRATWLRKEDEALFSITVDLIGHGEDRLPQMPARYSLYVDAFRKGGAMSFEEALDEVFALQCAMSDHGIRETLAFAPAFDRVFWRGLLAPLATAVGIQQKGKQPGPESGDQHVGESVASDEQGLRLDAQSSKIDPPAAAELQEVAGLGLEPSAQQFLARRIQTVREGLNATIAVATALAELFAYRDGVLWKSTHGNFEKFCRDKFGIGKSQSYRLRDAGAFVLAITSQSPRGDCVPVNEKQIRPLMRLPEERRGPVWESLVASTPAAKLTSRVVARRVHEELVNSTSRNCTDSTPPACEPIAIGARDNVVLRTAELFRKEVVDSTIYSDIVPVLEAIIQLIKSREEVMYP